jgi:predicted metal-dependent hydrolase
MSGAGFQHGIELMNRGEYYDAHEVLEDVWRACDGPEKKFLQGLIQLAVALHHHSKGNHVGARSLLARSARNLQGYPEGFMGIPLGEVLQSISECQRAVEAGNDLPPLVKL